MNSISTKGLAVLASCCAELRDHLQRAKRLIDEQIRHYPKPIPRCDAQFNHLYEQRDRIAAALDRITAALDTELAEAEPLALLTELLASGPWCDDEPEQELRRRLLDRIEAWYARVPREERLGR